MKVLIIGSGIAGMTAAIKAVEKGHEAVLVSSVPSEQSQSVMAAGGINASLKTGNEEEAYLSHAEDTLKGGCYIENREDVISMCRRAPEHIWFLESLGVAFSRDENLNLSTRLLGGHSEARTEFAGTITGKQIVTGLINKCREYECKGLIKRILYLHFHSALIRDGICYGAVFANALTGRLTTVFADVTVAATGGQNRIYGLTTGSVICDGYAAARLFTQGVRLRNLEFVQFHPTAIRTEHKMMLVSEGARGEGGRLFYEADGKRVYFMEDKYGENGNLMPRDVVAREISLCPSQVYLDVTFLSPEVIKSRLEELSELCRMYLGLDVTKEPIPVSPAVHFFMGGIRVDSHHRTDIRDLYAIGECASKYHGANRLGGNSLLAAVHSGTVAAEDFESRTSEGKMTLKEAETCFAGEISGWQAELDRMKESKSRFPCNYVFHALSDCMNRSMGIARNGSDLEKGLKEIEYMKKTVGKLNFDPQVSLYENYRIEKLLVLAEAMVRSALWRKESRGAHWRSDYPETDEAFGTASVVSLKDGLITVGPETAGGKG